ncbi:MAG: FKBP-type peptidyl-prolyl cis-trans isomerase [Rhodospirillaceae bacterium]|nr:FKBP-type peptidyl-prolyl cis-trans isomerase [Rhodospirillaceae bacterium]
MTYTHLAASIKNTVIGIMVMIFIIGAGGPINAAEGEKNKNLKITDLKKGTGEEAIARSKVSVHYTGWLEDGSKFDSSLDRGTPFKFTLGASEVIKGWDYGVEGMRVGGKRELVIPPELGYGPKGYPGAIPPNATLKFEVELMDVSAPSFTNINNAELKALLAKGVTIVDIRTAKEWSQTGIIEGSKLITSFDETGRAVQTFPQNFAEVAGKDDEVIIICRSGNRTASIATYLADRAGYKKVYNVTNGINGWIKENYPVVKN